MEQLSSKQRRYLKGEAHHLKPLAQVGKRGITKAFVVSTIELLGRHELLKVKFNEFKDEKKELFSDLVKATGGHCVGMVGNTGIVYKQHPKVDERRYELPE